MTKPVTLERNATGWQVVGELTFATVTPLAADPPWLTSTHSGDLPIDLSAVSRADSAGVALLLAWLRQAQVAGVTLRYQQMPAQMASIVQLCGLTQLLPLTEMADRKVS